MFHYGGPGSNLAFDPVGGSLLKELIKSLRERGSVVSIGFAGSAEACLDLAEVVIHEKRLLGYDAWLETDDAVPNAFSAIRAFIEKGVVRPVIDSACKLEEHEEAYKRLASRQAIGIILLKA
ncbi:zinc-binding dehydrogenase [Gluconobacter sp. Dm-44]|nr:zinc-binding dehydrogenase [Gluconobacter sp. Dm-44]